MEKNNLNIKIVDKDGNEIGRTYSKRAKGLLKSGRARLEDLETICLLDYDVSEKKGLSKISIPRYSLGEELVNSISHGIGALLSIAALILCVIFSKDAYGVVSSCLYGVTSILLYTMSCLYHSFKVNRAKKVFRIIDHCTIYLLIAGTYTPYALVTLRSYSSLVGWLVFGIIWGSAIIGIILNAIDLNKYKVFSMILYLIMGWMIIFKFKILLNNIDPMGIRLMLLGGILYTIGAIFYGIGKKIKYMHGIFHVFVLTASILFFFSIFLYVI